MGRIALYIVLAALTAAISGAIYIVWSAGVFVSVTPRFDGSCTSLSGQTDDGPGLIGVEDIVIDHERAMAYVSAIDRRDLSAPRGAIYLVPLYPDEGPLLLNDLTEAMPQDLHPHGIDLYIDEDGTRRLFVVSHAGGRRSEQGSYILIYRLGETGYLELQETVSNPGIIHHPNNVAAIGPREFFVTLDLAAASNSLQEKVDIALKRRTGALVHVRNGKARKVAGPFAMANGVAFDRSTATLYVAETLKRAVHAFRVTDKGGLLPLDRVSTPGHVDNIAMSDSGDLYIAGHIDVVAFARLMADADRISPSDIIRFDAAANGNALSGGPTEIMQTDGGPQFGANTGLSAMTVAAVHRNIMLIGSVYDPNIWRCEMAPSEDPVIASAG